MPKQAWWRLVRFGFRLLYHEMAFTYDTVANVVSLGQWWAWQRTALAYLPPPTEGSILELAFGTGRFQLDLCQRGWQSFGCDLSWQMGQLAKRRLQRQGIPIRLAQGQAQQLPFPNHYFAAVVSTFPTPFIVEEATLAEIRRVLMPGHPLVFVANGVLTRGGAAKTVLEGAFQATGQRGSWGIDLPQRFGASGFKVTQHTIPLQRSLVTVIVAE